MTKVGVIGIGFMGRTHLEVYRKRRDAKVVAVADLVRERREGRTAIAGNIAGAAKEGFDFRKVTKYAEPMDLVGDPEVELVDVCLPTPLHVEVALAALRRGKHVLVEKPLARTARDADRLARAAAKAKGLSMCAMCMRFWPGWTWLKESIDRKSYGRVLAAQFRRATNHPGGAFYSSGEQCGGAILDLHIHDTDFVQHCFGVPKAVSSRGYSSRTSAIDHVVTHYVYDDVPLVVAEGSWAMTAGFGFQMQYAVNFERATAVFDLAAAKPLTLHERGKKARAVAIPPGMGYDHEIAYFLDCIRTRRRPKTVTLADAATSVRIVEAEARSIATGRPVRV
ncbi:MAG: Gfo/Idh/MocA family oxidoreductase [Planctomycetes bacterium]|nr:Gfo/Idh/MocA family oxidoreductase [Planctomycetota bacterium]MBI3845685.1 Gfo/Idh/MocA family oxidoreductase [Planctomycetota bacterium]